MARPAATGPMKVTAARQMRRTAQLLDFDHPETVAGGHLRDAARVLEHGHTDGAKRHLDAAMELLTPRNLIRHGILDDEGHATAKHHMHQVHRHRLAVQDIEDTAARNARFFSAAQPEPGVASARPVPAGAQLATELSARTAMLERTPAPRGRPGGPGLYDVAGMGHTAYLQQIVKALIEKRGMKPGKAYAIARAAIRRWMSGGGHVHPEVRAAAGRAEAGEQARQARAKASHGHAVSGWELADTLIELACEPIELFNPYHAPTGQFTTSTGAGQGQGKQPSDSRRDAAKRRMLRARIASLRSRITGLQAQLRSAPRPGSRTRSKAATPAAKGAGALSAKQAAAKPGAAARKTGTAARTTARAASSPAQIRAQIGVLRRQLAAAEAALKRV